MALERSDGAVRVRSTPDSGAGAQLLSHPPERGLRALGRQGPANGARSAERLQLLCRQGPGCRLPLSARRLSSALPLGSSAALLRVASSRDPCSATPADSASAGRIDRARGLLAARSNRKRRLSNARKRLSYANVAATLALVFSMTGGAMAANHYLISSTKQIKPSILKKLKGNAGAKGATGAQGAQGAQGGAGPQGPAGTVVPSRPSAGRQLTRNATGHSQLQERLGGERGRARAVLHQHHGSGRERNRSVDLATASEPPDTVQFNFSGGGTRRRVKLCPASTTVLAETITSKDKPETLDAWVSFPN